MINRFQVIAIREFDGALIPEKEYTVIETCIDNGKDWYKIEKTENGYTWIPASAFKRLAQNDRRKVYHVLQKIVEYYEFTPLHGWRNVSPSIAGDWQSGTFEYVELRHNQEMDKTGLFGSHIKG